MKFTNLAIYLLITLALFSCENENSKQLNHEDETLSIDTSTNSLMFSYLPGSIKVNWTARKHSNEAKVEGGFDSVTIDGFLESSDIVTAMSGVTFNIFTSSTNTNDKVRDLTIVNSFFGKLKSSLEIVGSISNIEGVNNGTGAVLIEMNNVKKEVAFQWKLDESDRFLLKTIINILDWDASSAFNFLNTACLEKHTGPDGKNKLWPDVEVRVFTTLKRK